MPDTLEDAIAISELVDLYWIIINNQTVQFLYSALSSNELKAIYIIPPAHLYTPTLSQLLKGAYNADTRYKAQG